MVLLPIGDYPSEMGSEIAREGALGISVSQERPAKHGSEGAAASERKRHRLGGRETAVAPMTRKGRWNTRLSDEGKTKGRDRLSRSWLSCAPRPTPVFTFVKRRRLRGVYAPKNDRFPGEAVVMLG